MAWACERRSNAVELTARHYVYSHLQPLLVHKILVQLIRHPIHQTLHANQYCCTYDTFLLADLHARLLGFVYDSCQTRHHTVQVPCAACLLLAAPAGAT